MVTFLLSCAPPHQEHLPPLPFLTTVPINHRKTLIVLAHARVPLCSRSSREPLPTRSTSLQDCNKLLGTDGHQQSTPGLPPTVSTFFTESTPLFDAHQLTHLPRLLRAAALVSSCYITACCAISEFTCAGINQHDLAHVYSQSFCRHLLSSSFWRSCQLGDLTER